MSNVLQFKKAVKHDARGRVALVGPGGSGKSFTMLELARLLAGPTGKIAVVDTEHGSASKYADLYEFDVIELDSFTPDKFLGALDAAEANQYDVFCCDSLSHFWMGKDGALEFVDERKKRTRDQMEGWKDWRPHERAMVDRMIASPCHVIVTMRTKNEYKDEQYTDGQGRTRTKRVKIGLAPVQREGLEYEFDLVGYMTDENVFVVDKTRCPLYSGRAITKPGEKEFQPFRDWLKGAKREPAAVHGGGEVPRPTNAAGTKQDVKSPTSPGSNGSLWDWKVVLVPFEAIEKTIGTEAYVRLLGAEGYSDISELPDRDTAKRVYQNVKARAIELVPEPWKPEGTVTPPPKQETTHTAMPAALDALWKRIVDIKSGCVVLGELKKELFELAGEERGRVFYYTALSEFGVDHANRFRNTSKARQCASRLWERIELLKYPPPHNPDITDDDVPRGDIQNVLREELVEEGKDGLLLEARQPFCEYAD